MVPNILQNKLRAHSQYTIGGVVGVGRGRKILSARNLRRGGVKLQCKPFEGGSKIGLHPHLIFFGIYRTYSLNINIMALYYFYIFFKHKYHGLKYISMY